MTEHALQLNENGVTLTCKTIVSFELNKCNINTNSNSGNVCLNNTKINCTISITIFSQSLKGLT